MAQQYLMTCDCEATHAVSTCNAGETISCECGKKLEVPAMREMRHLPVAESSRETEVARRRWSLAHGLLFAVAVPLFLGCVALAGRAFFIMQTLPRVRPTVQDVLTHHPDGLLRVDIDSLTPAQGLEYWRAIHSAATLTRISDPPHIQIQNRKNQLSRFIGYSSGGALMGLLAIIAMIVNSRGGRAKATQDKR